MVDPHLLAIELRHLRYFLAVFEELHFERAAMRLGMTRSPLARSIRSLEAGLGVALFLRTSQGVRPTAAAEALARETRQLFGAFESAIVRARRVGDT